MKPMDMSELIKGLMVVIGIALAIGKLPELKQWAARKAFAPQRGNPHLVLKIEVPKQ